MDRLNRTLAGCGLTLLLAAGGCKSTRPEVPPGRSYTSDGRQVPPIGFSNDPHGMTGPGNGAGMPGAPGVPQLGTPGPASSANYGAPAAGQFGPPGTAMGAGQMPPGMGYSGTGAESGSMPSGGLEAPSGGQGMTPPPSVGTSPGAGVPPSVP